MNNLWAFRKISAIEEPIFNNTLERFYNLGIDGLVRENIQNSLDGRLPEASLPVRVIINTGITQPREETGRSGQQDDPGTDMYIRKRRLKPANRLHQAQKTLFMWKR